MRRRSEPVHLADAEQEHETLDTPCNRARPQFRVDRGRQHEATDTDPLTNLPLYPANDSRLHLGNERTRLPESTVCGSKMQADFYTVYDSKVDVTLGWYGADLPDFKKTHAYAAIRSQDTFYNSVGTISVSVTGSSGRAGENAETYSVVYARF